MCKWLTRCRLTWLDKMRKAIAILMLGVIVACAGFSAFYFFGAARQREILCEPSPELAWLKKEFDLSESEYARITELHAAYLPACQERCRRISEKDAELKQLLTKTNYLSPEIQKN